MELAEKIQTLLANLSEQEKDLLSQYLTQQESDFCFVEHIADAISRCSKQTERYSVRHLGRYRTAISEANDLDDFEIQQTEWGFNFCVIFYAKQFIEIDEEGEKYGWQERDGTLRLTLVNDDSIVYTKEWEF